jgi:H/ACA ribonucleoprotein complex subunit 2
VENLSSVYLQERIRRLTFDLPIAAAQRTLKRGVKEVVKALRKSTSSSTTTSSPPIGVVILAADISPMDVISHIPVLCEDHNIPYIYVTSRAELGMAGQTKRPTSVVMVVGAAGKKGGKDGKEVGGEGDTAEWDEVFKGLVKTVEREGRHVKV